MRSKLCDESQHITHHAFVSHFFIIIILVFEYHRHRRVDYSKWLLDLSVERRNNKILFCSSLRNNAAETAIHTLRQAICVN